MATPQVKISVPRATVENGYRHVEERERIFRFWGIPKERTNLERIDRRITRPELEKGRVNRLNLYRQVSKAIDNIYTGGSLSRSDYPFIKGATIKLVSNLAAAQMDLRLEYETFKQPGIDGWEQAYNNLRQEINSHITSIAELWIRDFENFWTPRYYNYIEYFNNEANTLRFLRNVVDGLYQNLVTIEQDNYNWHPWWNDKLTTEIKIDYPPTYLPKNTPVAPVAVVPPPLPNNKPKPAIKPAAKPVVGRGARNRAGH